MEQPTRPAAAWQRGSTYVNPQGYFKRGGGPLPLIGNGLSLRFSTAPRIARQLVRRGFGGPIPLLHPARGAGELEGAAVRAPAATTLTT